MWINPEHHRVVGEHLAKLRQDANVTQAELARRLAKPQSFVSSYERGQRRIDLLELANIVAALGGDLHQVGTELLAAVSALVARRSTQR